MIKYHAKPNPTSFLTHQNCRMIDFIEKESHYRQGLFLRVAFHHIISALGLTRKKEREVLIKIKDLKSLLPASFPIEILEQSCSAFSIQRYNRTHYLISFSRSYISNVKSVIESRGNYITFPISFLLKVSNLLNMRMALLLIYLMRIKSKKTRIRIHTLLDYIYPNWKNSVKHHGYNRISNKLSNLLEELIRNNIIISNFLLNLNNVKNNSLIEIKLCNYKSPPITINRANLLKRVNMLQKQLMNSISYNPFSLLP